MTRQAARYEEDGVDADIVACAHKARRQPLGGDGDAAKPIAIERNGRALFAGARLDLDEGECPPAAGDDIDFAAGHSRALGENPPAVEAQPPGGQQLGLAASLLSKLAAVQRLSSRARA